MAGMAGTFSGSTANALGNQSRETKSVAAVITVYFQNSHADVLLTKIMEGWKHDRGPGPDLRLASIYIDQPEGSEFGLEVLKRNNTPIFETIEQAVTVGGNSIPVDGVLSIGEHGKYPVNALGQQLYPRKRFFEQITDAFKKYQRVVPVFNDKHISTVWNDAKWMYDRAQEMKVPFMAGSSLPLTYRTHPIDLPLGSEIESVVGIGYSGLDIYGFHALECFQTLVERRANAERGVKWVRCLEGKAVWELVDSGWVDADVLQAALDIVPRSVPTVRDDPGVVLFQFEYVDGLRGSLFMVPSASRNGVAIKRKGHPIMATSFEERPEPKHPHFAYLLKGIEQMIHSGRPPYPVERTLLTGGILDRALKSKFEGGTVQQTPELQIAYTPVDYPHAPEPNLVSDIQR
ncbi:MAG: hypothetical protein KGQ51_04640 [Planctomycetes bacterium]|nr:hypothetical protein [Planctomycetota bacterium]